MDTAKSKKVRRTKQTLEKDLFNAAIKIVSEVGFSGLTVSLLMKETKAESQVFYNRYRNIDEFIDKFVREFDYWLTDTVAFHPEENTNAIKNAQNIINGLIDSLLENSCMQKLLAWELNEDNYITRRTSQNRDNNLERLIEYFEKALNGCEVNFNVGTAILIGGVYYLIIHRKMGTFNKIDFNTKEGIELLKKNISIMYSKIFDDYNVNKNQIIEEHTINIAKELLKNGIDPSIVQCSTGLTEKVISSLNDQITN